MNRTELGDIVTDSLVAMVTGVTGMVPPKGEAIPEFIQGPIDLATDRIFAALVQPAEQHQGDAIGTLLRDYDERIVFTPIGDPHIIDDMKVYTHADPGEVERLRAMVELAESEALSAIVERDDLRAQLTEAQQKYTDELGNRLAGEVKAEARLAERDALLESAAEGASVLLSLIENIEAKGNYSPESTVSFLQQALHCVSPALSSSAGAELSAPVERDERAAFEYHHRVCDLVRDEDCPEYYRNQSVQDSWEGWQMRAALERNLS